jgi:hypothetical protein
MHNRKIDSKNTFQVVIDVGWWEILSALRTNTQKPFKELVEDALSNTYAIDKNGNPYFIKKEKNNP